ncbi:MAG: hypothetical protein JO359_09135 [Candidatus Eremiobacteraeota bacterium]|nr:hypothetical protein [Candidatus Eremiobacteraeota bacterium]
MLVPALLLVCGLVLIAVAILLPMDSAPPGYAQASATPIGPGDRIRALEHLGTVPERIDALTDALRDPDLEVAAVAAVLLEGAGRSDLVRASPRVDDLLKLVPAWRR